MTKERKTYDVSEYVPPVVVVQMSASTASRDNRLPWKATVEACMNDAS